ncbi:hydroxyacylglutathione hydrolase [Motilimonas pumila]|uniref:Hydroxyacylglutathione hydrolase n=1 Tax=Motilimonas pumila TaxID=2303987 RepID=A0A418YBE2_9GAMM|nr:hydroxyacylglutathione hydrolase [Motilimonas pumila]RJG40234.1 hydroxyacylglutathione hydrolase [Motilimonas pumila]
MLKIITIPAFQDNYIWLIQSTEPAVSILVDPGDANAACDYLSKHNISLDAILLTHYHGDHMGAVLEICHQQDADVTIYAPHWQDTPAGLKVPTKYNISQHATKVSPGDTIDIKGLSFTVMDLSGHTLEHVGYLHQDHLFSGDSLFSAGCGRVFEGSMAQMQQSLARIAALPQDTVIYPAHEYTLNNLSFALKVEPDNQDLLRRLKQVAKCQQQGVPSVPVTLAQEITYNPFLRVQHASVQHAVQLHFALPTQDNLEVFSLLRKWKDES